MKPAGQAAAGAPVRPEAQRSSGSWLALVALVAPVPTLTVTVVCSWVAGLGEGDAGEVAGRGGEQVPLAIRIASFKFGPPYLPGHQAGQERADPGEQAPTPASHAPESSMPKMSTTQDFSFGFFSRW